MWVDGRDLHVREERVLLEQDGTTSTMCHVEAIRQELVIQVFNCFLQGDVHMFVFVRLCFELVVELYLYVYARASLGTKLGGPGAWDRQHESSCCIRSVTKQNTDRKGSVLFQVPGVSRKSLSCHLPVLSFSLQPPSKYEQSRSKKFKNIEK